MRRHHNGLNDYNIPAGVVDDLFHDTADVAIALGEVEVAQAGGVLVVMGVRLELLCSNFSVK